MSAVINPKQLKASFEQIETLHKENQGVVLKISEGIKAFERRLQRLEGRTQACVSEKTEDGVVTLSFEQQGSNWRLLLATKSPNGASSTGELLTGVSTDRQMNAIRMLPALLDEMIHEHERRSEELAPALATFAETGIAEVGMYADS